MYRFIRQSISNMSYSSATQLCYLSIDYKMNLKFYILKLDQQLKWISSQFIRMELWKTGFTAVGQEED